MQQFAFVILLTFIFIAFNTAFVGLSCKLSLLLPLFSTFLIQQCGHPAHYDCYTALKILTQFGQGIDTSVHTQLQLKLSIQK